MRNGDAKRKLHEVLSISAELENIPYLIHVIGRLAYARNRPKVANTFAIVSRFILDHSPGLRGFEHLFLGASETHAPALRICGLIGDTAHEIAINVGIRFWMRFVVPFAIAKVADPVYASDNPMLNATSICTDEDAVLRHYGFLVTAIATCGTPRPRDVDTLKTMLAQERRTFLLNTGIREWHPDVKTGDQNDGSENRYVAKLLEFFAQNPEAANGKASWIVENVRGRDQELYNALRQLKKDGSYLGAMDEEDGRDS